ncbi:MAG: ABC transporter permease [Gemmatimonadetes bacterium]|nr:ABC transporter permease [Gemmatimonadota bacterium]
MSFVTELRRAIRSVAREPMVAILAVAALSLGIGLPAAQFSLLNGFVLRGMPVDEPRQVMHLERVPVGSRGEGWGAPARDYLAWKDQQRAFVDLAAFTYDNVALRAGMQTNRWDAVLVTPGLFPLLRAQPLLGRTISPDDDLTGTPPVMISHIVWRDQFASDAGVLGTTVFIDGAPHTVIGVMPEGFRFPIRQDVWLPVTIGPAQSLDADFADLDVLGRLNDGTSLGAARAEFKVIAARLTEQFPETNRDTEIRIRPVTVRYMGETATATIWAFLAAVLLVLVIACTNVANLLLVRAIHRVRDLAVRVALGAGRARIVTSLLLESAVLAVLGGAGGIIVGLAATAGLERVMVGRLPFWGDLTFDMRVLAFVLAITLVAALIAGMLPALRAMNPDIQSTLRDESRGSTGIRMGRVMRGLVVLQVALSLALLATTGLMLRGINNLNRATGVFDTDRIFTARVTVPDDYDEPARAQFFRDLEARLAAEPGITAVALGSDLPATHSNGTRFAIEGRQYADDSALHFARVAVVTNDFFRTFSASAVRGRTFGSEDAAGGLQTALINERLAARWLGGEDPIGQRIRFGPAGDAAAWRTIVGIVPDLWMNGLDSSGDRNPAGLYLPLEQARPRSMGIALLGPGAEPLALTPRIRDIVFSLDNDVPLYEVRAMPGLIEDNSWFFAMGAGIMGTCGLAALLLATIGLYGVVAFSVGRRTREIGIRMAMGAAPTSIVGLMLRRGVAELLIGTLFGLGLAAVISRGVGSMLFEVSPNDPVVFIGVSLILLAITLAATLIPALRAARIDPLAALRAE